MKALLPANEEARLRALHEYQILDTPNERLFDDVTRLASYICGTPIAMVSLVDGNRQWFKSKVGTDVAETPRDVAFCAHAILQPDELLIVPDATQDTRFSDSTLVTDDPKIRFYAGAPLVTPEGFALGALCVIDRTRKELQPEQASALKTLRDLLMRELELRRVNNQLAHSIKMLTEAEQSLLESEKRHREMVMDSLGLICSHDQNGKLFLVNPAAAAALGYEVEELIGKNMGELLSPSIQHLWPAYLQRLRENKIDVGLLRVVSKKGTEHIWAYRNVVKEEPGREPYVIGHAQDVTERHVLEEKLRQQAVRDPLTHLFNRRYMEESIERELRRARRNKRPLSVIMVDVDYFKKFNDLFGHDAGDTILCEIARLLERNIRAEDIACRYGGEEFVLVLADMSLSVACQRAEFLRTQITQLAVRHAGQSLGSITFSLGVAVFPDHGVTWQAVLHAADQALYIAKNGGRDRVAAIAVAKREFH